MVSRSTENSLGAMVVNTATTEEAGGSVFGVARYNHNLGEQSRAGGMLVVRQDFAKGALLPVTNIVPVIDGLARAGPLTLSATGTGSFTQEGPTVAPKLGGAGTANAQIQDNWGELNVSLTGISPDYDARAGFVGRTEVLVANCRWYFDLRPTWLPWWLRSIHQYGEVYTVISTRDGSFQEANAYLEPLWVRSSGGDRMWFSGQHSTQVLSEVFSPVPGVAVPKGRYDFDQFTFAAFTEPSRPASAGLVIGGGKYYRADRFSVQAQAGFQPLPHVSLFFRYDYNHFDGQDVLLGGAVTHLLLGEARLALSPKLQLVGSYQRDTSGNFSIANARLVWEFLPLSFVYVVFTDTRSAFVAPDAVGAEQKLVVKVAYTWRL